MKNKSSADINESLFKKAKNAITFTSNQDLNITNNEFKNNQDGVVIDIPSEENLTGNLTGNTFTVSKKAPNFNGGHFFGIKIARINLNGKISQNDFIHSAHENKDFYGIKLFENAQAIVISENRFTDMDRSIDVSNATNVQIKNNHIASNTQQDSVAYQVKINRSDAVTVFSNTLKSSVNYPEWSQKRAALYAEKGAFIDIAQNQITGYSSAIQVEKPGDDYKVIENTIKNARYYGIYIHNDTVGNQTISCNTINMDIPANGSAIGIGYFLSGIHQAQDILITSNCIFETTRAVYLSNQSGSDRNLPRIRSNYLNNYSKAGIQNVNFGGNIGTGSTWAEAGRNSFMSNNLGSSGTYDIVTNTLIDVFSNFGLRINYITNSSLVDFNNDKPFRSIATCGRHIESDEIGAYWDEYKIKKAERCKELTRDILDLAPIEVEPPTPSSITNEQSTPSILSSKFLSAKEQFNFSYAKGGINTLAGSNQEEGLEAFYSTLKNSPKLSEQEKRRLAYIYLKQKGQYQQSLNVLNNIEDVKLKSLQKPLTKSYLRQEPLGSISLANQIETQSSKYYHDFRQFENNDGKFPFSPMKRPAALNKTPNASENQNLIKVEPNPVQNKAHVNYRIQNAENAKLQLISTNGKPVKTRNLNYNRSETTLDFSGLSHGVYFVILKNENGIRDEAKIIHMK